MRSRHMQKVMWLDKPSIEHSNRHSWAHVKVSTTLDMGLAFARAVSLANPMLCPCPPSMAIHL